MATSKKQAAATKARAGAANLTGKGVGYFDGFLTFIREQGVIGLAVGLAIGTAAGATVKVIVDQLINPLVGLLTRGVDLNSLKWVLIDKKGSTAEIAIGYGAILSSLIVLLATAFVIYQLIHIAKLDRMDKKKS